jgi:hypothetical protein
MERPEDEFEQVRLVLARRRALGDPFEQAWRLALGAVPPIERNGRFPTAAERDHDSSLNALRATEADWQAAHNRSPPPPVPCPQRPSERALSRPRKAAPVDEAALIAAGLLSPARASRQAA